MKYQMASNFEEYAVVQSAHSIVAAPIHMHIDPVVHFTWLAFFRLNHVYETL